MALIPSIFGGRHSNLFDPFSIATWDPLLGSLDSARDTTQFANARIDWKETPEAHIFKADLPGLKKEEFKVEVTDERVLQISGERSKEQEEKNDKFHRIERSSGSFSRSFRLPDNAKIDEVKAAMDNGVLTVTVPKVEIKKPQVKSIEISGFVRGYTKLWPVREEMVGPVRPQFVLFGSSFVQLSFSEGGWGAILADIYSRKADIFLRGYSGWNSRLALQVLDQVFPKDAAVQPSLVIVEFGGNDSMGPPQGPQPGGLRTLVPLPEYIENMKKIALHLKGLSEKTRVIFLSAPPVNEKMIPETIREFLGEIVRTNESCGVYSEACLKLCKELDVEAVNLWTALQQRDDWLTACFIDGIHLSSEGNKIVVKEILKVLRETAWEPSLHGKSMATEFDSLYNPVSADGKTNVNAAAAFESYRYSQWE